MENEIIKFKNYLEEMEKSSNTTKKYVNDIRDFYHWMKDKIVCKTNVVQYKEYIKSKGIKVSTINSKISSLNAYFTFIKNNDFKLKYLRCQKVLFKSEDKELSRYDFNKLYEVANNEKKRLLLEIMAETGIRVSEIEYITKGSIECGKATINNKGKIRVILIPRKLCIKLINYCDKKKIYEGSIFVTRNKKPLSRKYIWQMLKNLARKANVDDGKVFPHNFRHLFAREFYKNTHDIVKLSSILGHSNIETTSIYVRNTEEECREDIERVRFVSDI